MRLDARSCSSYVELQGLYAELQRLCRVAVAIWLKANFLLGFGLIKAKRQLSSTFTPWPYLDLSTSENIFSSWEVCFILLTNPISANILSAEQGEDISSSSHIFYTAHFMYFMYSPRKINNYFFYLYLLLLLLERLSLH